VRTYRANGFYHIFNRGVDKCLIYKDDQDYQMFMYYLFVYLAPTPEVTRRYRRINLNLLTHNLSSEIRLIDYCLMPNHFHLLVQSRYEDSIPKLLQQLTNAYTQYFNRKYYRVGSLVQGPYKSVSVESEAQLVHLSRYILNNPVDASLSDRAASYVWSSFPHHFSSPDGFTDTSAIDAHFRDLHNFEAWLRADHSTPAMPTPYVSLISQLTIE
jgi:putative transposase